MPGTCLKQELICTTGLLVLQSRNLSWMKDGRALGCNAGSSCARTSAPAGRCAGAARVKALLLYTHCTLGSPVLLRAKKAGPQHLLRSALEGVNGAKNTCERNWHATSCAPALAIAASGWLLLGPADPVDTALSAGTGSLHH